MAEGSAAKKDSSTILALAITASALAVWGGLTTYQLYSNKVWIFKPKAPAAGRMYNAKNTAA